MIRTHRRFVFLMAAAWMLAGQPSPFTNPAAQSLKSTTICPTHSELENKQPGAVLATRDDRLLRWSNKRA